MTIGRQVLCGFAPALDEVVHLVHQLQMRFGHVVAQKHRQPTHRPTTLVQEKIRGWHTPLRS